MLYPHAEAHSGASQVFKMDLNGFELSLESIFVYARMHLWHILLQAINEIIDNPWVISYDVLIIRILQLHCFTIVFWIHCSFFIVYLFDGKFADQMFFFFLQGKICMPEKSGASQRFCARARPIGIGHRTCPDLII